MKRNEDFDEEAEQLICYGCDQQIEKEDQLNVCPRCCVVPFCTMQCYRECFEKHRKDCRRIQNVNNPEVTKKSGQRNVGTQT